MATLKEMKDLAVYSAKGTAPENYTVESVNEALVDGIRELAGTYNAFMKNRYDIYEIITTAADEIVPNKVISAMSPFAEVRVVSNGQKVMFKKGIGKNRAKKFYYHIDILEYFKTGIIVEGKIMHHIIEIKDDFNTADDINNLIYLTDSNHKTVHALYEKSQKDKTYMQNVLFSLIKKWEEEYRLSF